MESLGELQLQNPGFWKALDSRGFWRSLDRRGGRYGILEGSIVLNSCFGPGWRCQATWFRLLDLGGGLSLTVGVAVLAAIAAFLDSKWRLFMVGRFDAGRASANGPKSLTSWKALRRMAT